jgi:hypothetical protein
MICVNIVILAFLVHLVGVSLEIGSLDNEFNSLKIYLIDSSWHARDLDIENKSLVDGKNYQIFTDDIASNSDYVSNALDSLDKYDSNPLIKELHDSSFLRSNLQIWQLIGGEHYSYSMSFQNALKRFLYSSERVLTKDITSLNLTDPDLYYIYSNPIGDMRKACEDSLQKFEEVEKKFIEDMRSNLQFCLIGVGLVFSFSIGFIASKLYYVQQSSSSIWRFIYSVSAHNLVELQRKALDRLCNVHMIELEARINKLPRRIK